MPRPYITYTENIAIGDIVADSDALLYALWKTPNAVKLVNARIGVKATVSKADTNYNTMQIKNGSNVVAAAANGPVATGSTFTLGTFVDMVVTPAYQSIASGDTLSFKITKTGTGLAMTGVVLQVEFMDINP